MDPHCPFLALLEPVTAIDPLLPVVSEEVEAPKFAELALWAPKRRVADLLTRVSASFQNLLQR
jgi:hypothetical protein